MNEAGFYNRARGAMEMVSLLAEALLPWLSWLDLLDLIRAVRRQTAAQPEFAEDSAALELMISPLEDTFERYAAQQAQTIWQGFADAVHEKLEMDPDKVLLALPSPIVGPLAAHRALLEKIQAKPEAATLWKTTFANEWNRWLAR